MNENVQERMMENLNELVEAELISTRYSTEEMDIDNGDDDGYPQCGGGNVLRLRNHVI